MKPNVPHPMIDIYGAFGFLTIGFAWLVWLRNDFTAVTLTPVDTSKPIFSRIRKIIKGVMSRSSVDALLEWCSPVLKGRNSAFIVAIASGLFPQKKYRSFE